MVKLNPFRDLNKYLQTIIVVTKKVLQRRFPVDKFLLAI